MLPISRKINDVDLISKDSGSDSAIDFRGRAFRMKISFGRPTPTEGDHQLCAIDIQIQMHKYTNTNTQIQMHKYRCTQKDTQIHLLNTHQQGIINSEPTMQ